MRPYLSKLLLLPLLMLIGLSGCSQDGAPENSNTTATTTTTDPIPTVMTPGDYPQVVSIGGTVRQYILHVPQGYDGTTSLPLVFVLHGFGGSAGSMVKLTGMDAKADLEHFFVAYLQGTVGPGGGPGWNSGITPETGITVDDVAFVRDLLEQLEGQLSVDAKRVYAAGFSNGAFMCHRLGAELPDILAGVAMVEGTIGISQDQGTTYNMIPAAKGPIPVVMVHGEEDPNVPYNGGPGGGAGQLYVKSVADALAFWTTADGCTGSPLTETSPNGNVITEDHNTCSNGSEVELLTVVNGLHEWPTLQGHTGFSATDAIWEFFSRHSK